MQLLPGTPLVDTNHGNTNGPGGLANTQAEIAVVGVDVSAFLGSLDDLYYRLKNTFVETPFFKFAE